MYFIVKYNYMTVKERLIKFAKTKEKSVRAFEIKTGLTIGYINAIRVSIQPDKIERIASCYSDLNADWLLTGEGEMLKSPKNEFSQLTEDEISETIADRFAYKIMDMYKSGEIISSEVHNRIVGDKENQILKLQQEVWKLQQEIEALKKP